MYFTLPMKSFSSSSSGRSVHPERQHPERKQDLEKYRLLPRSSSSLVPSYASPRNNEGSEKVLPQYSESDRRRPRHGRRRRLQVNPGKTSSHFRSSAGVDIRGFRFSGGDLVLWWSACEGSSSLNRDSCIQGASYNWWVMCQSPLGAREVSAIRGQCFGYRQSECDVKEYW